MTAYYNPAVADTARSLPRAVFTLNKQPASLYSPRMLSSKDMVSMAETKRLASVEYHSSKDSKDELEFDFDSIHEDDDDDVVLTQPVILKVRPKIPAITITSETIK